MASPSRDWFGRFAEALIAHNLAAGEDARRQAKRILAFALAMLVWVPVYATVLEWLNAPLSSYFVLWAGMALALIMASLRLGLPPVFSGNLLVGAAWTCYTGLALVHGCTLGPSTMWYASIPLMALWLLGTAWGVFWTLASLAAIGALGMSSELGMESFNELTPEGLEILHFLGLLGIVCCVFILVSVLRKAENNARGALYEALVRAEGADRAKSEFLANVSHEIRTPMTAILGFAEMLGDEEGEASLPRDEALAAIRRNGQHLMQIIGDVLDLSKIEAGRMTVESIDCSPLELARDAVELVRMQADAKGLSLSLQDCGEVPKTIRSDPTRLRQILINILNNAVKFTDAGEVSLHVGRCDEGLEFVVRDTGIGMTETQLASAFRPFVQADASTTRRFGGSGLGLAICKGLAERLGGNITAQSQPGVGSTFRVTIAAKRTDADTHRDRGGTAGLPVHEAQLAKRLDGRVLLAEDGPDNQRLIAFVLRNAGAEVVVVDNGEAAVQSALAARAAGEPFDVVLVDIQMPLVDGYEATLRLRSASYELPIVALTAHATSEDRRLSLEAGCDDYATKPIDRRALVAMVARYCGKASRLARENSGGGD